MTRNDNGQSYTTKLNGTTGNVVWEVNLGRKVAAPNSSPNPNAQTYSTVSTNDGGFITGFSSNNWGGRFIYARFDANGNFLWYKQNREYQNIRGGALALSDGSFAFTNFGDSTWSILKTTANGQLLPACTSNLPDLTLENLNLLNPSVQQGQILYWKVNIKNIGNGDATGNFNVKAYI